jgi:hypothetical protein
MAGFLASPWWPPPSSAAVGSIFLSTSVVTWARSHVGKKQTNGYANQQVINSHTILYGDEKCAFGASSVLNQ